MDSFDWLLQNRIQLPREHASFNEHMEYMSNERRAEEQFITMRAKEMCESPIEELVFLYLWYQRTQSSSFMYWPQKEIGPYRVDFCVEFEGRKLVIECDGHDFHEKTKAQAARDKRRDRYLTAEGYTVLHFTGSEIVKNPYTVVDEILDVVYSEMVRQDFGMQGS